MNLSRRSFLRAAGVSIALPWLEAALPRAFGSAAPSPKRMLFVGRPLGLHGPFFFPEKAGKDYEPSRYLQPLADHRADFTVFSGMSETRYPGGHHTENALLT